MDFLYLIFYACLRLQFINVEANPGPRCPVPDVCRILCSNVRSLAGNLGDLSVASSRYDILLCSKGWLHTYEMVTEHFVNPNLSVDVAKCWFLGCVV